MSSVPPTMPPGGAPPPFPPYDPKTQWRVYRAQQKAAWRAQRDAWKAQQYAWKAGYVGACGPRVPSVVGPILLIGVGVVALLLLTGHLDSGTFWGWYGHWWPLLLISAGLILLGEWALDLRRKTPVRRGGSFVSLLFLLALLGFGAAEWNHAGPWFNKQEIESGLNDDFFHAFGLPEHDSDQQVMSLRIPANASIQIENPCGDVSVTAGDGSAIEVQAHEVAYAGSDAEAKNIFAAEATHLTISGSAALVKAESNSRGRVDLIVTVPKTAKVTVNAGKGDVTATGLGAGISVVARGDLHLSAISGPVEARFAKGNSGFSAHDVKGGLTVDGDLNEITFSQIKGKVTQNGEILGDVHMEDVSGPIHLHTSVTDLEVAELPGDLVLDSDNLHVNEARGPVRVVTRSKDIDLNQIYGDCTAEDRNGSISIEPAGAYGVNAKNSKGNIEVTLPPNASATVALRAHNGDIVSDYAIPLSEGENKSAAFQIGSGASRIVLSAENGDVRIKKGPAFPSSPATAATTRTTAPNMPHLKTHKALPAQPVVQ